MLTGLRCRGDRGASMVIALAATVIMLGFGAVALRIVGDGAETIDQRLDRDRATLHAELAVSEGIARVIDGAETLSVGTGTVEGMEYRYTVTPAGPDRWMVVGEAGAGPSRRTVTSQLRRESSGEIELVDYEIWAEELDIRTTTGTLRGRIGASKWIRFTGDPIGDEQHLLQGATCTGCDAPVSVSVFAPMPTPPVSDALPCPYTTGRRRIRDTTIAAGTYFCDGNILRLRGTIDVAGPVVIHLDHNTRLNAINARINVDGDADEFHIVQAAGSTNRWSRIDDTTLIGHVSMPQARLLLDDDLAWDGRIHVRHARFRSADLDVGRPAGDGADRYAVYGHDLVDIGWVRSGDVDGPVGSGDRIKFWYRHSIGTTQQAVGICSGCPNPEPITGYDPLELPDGTAAAACPADAAYRITGPVTLSGSYRCDDARRTLRLSGEISVDGPVELHVGDDTRLDIRNASINLGGDSADFVIVKPDTTSWAYRSTVDDTTMHARILAPQNWVYVGDVTWRGTFEVGTWWLYDWANIDGAWDGEGAPEPVFVEITSWHLDRWLLS